MKVAAFQAPLAATRGVDAALGRIREQVARCESLGVGLLCCPEAVLGGLADDAPDPRAFAIDPRGGALERVLAPLASDLVTTVVGFTETDGGGSLHNAAAVLHRGALAGVYRKHHPAIRRSVYQAGREAPLFRVYGAAFGIVICRDSTFAEPARSLIAQGASMLLVPTNNALPRPRADPGIVAEARAVDVALAREHGVWVVRADVAGAARGRLSWGCSAIVDPAGTVRRAARPLTEELIVVDTREGGAEMSDETSA